MTVNARVEKGAKRENKERFADHSNSEVDFGVAHSVARDGLPAVEADISA
jgi:hypothetical protein